MRFHCLAQAWGNYPTLSPPSTPHGLPLAGPGDHSGLGPFPAPPFHLWRISRLPWLFPCSLNIPVCVTQQPGHRPLEGSFQLTGLASTCPGPGLSCALCLGLTAHFNKNPTSWVSSAPSLPPTPIMTSLPHLPLRQRTPSSLFGSLLFPSTTTLLGDLILSWGGNHSPRAGDSQTHSAVPGPLHPGPQHAGSAIYPKPPAECLS